MDRRTILAIALSFLIFFGWQKFYLEPRQQAYQQTQTQVTQQTTQAGGGAVNTGAPETRAAVKAGRPQPAAQRESIDATTGVAVVGNGAAFFEEWSLKEYTLKQDAEDKVDLNSVTNREGALRLAFDSPEYAYLTEVRGQLRKVSEGELVWTYEDENVRLQRRFLHEGDQPFVNVVVSGEFKKAPPKNAFVMIRATGIAEDDPEAMDRQLAYWTREEIDRLLLSDGVEQARGIATDVEWISALTRYFGFAVVAADGPRPKGYIRPIGANGGELSLMYPVTGTRFEFPMRTYFGPKDVELLKQVSPTLTHAVDYGFFEVFAHPLLQIMKWFYRFVENYGVAIILLTLLLKIVTFPLTYKSVKSMKEMAKIQPQLARLREKHKDDKEALNREMLTLMRTHGYNPMAGCLPILVQMPVFFALYKVLYSSVELYQAPFAFWIHDLSQRDPFYVTPVLLSGLMFLQQKLTPTTATDPTQQKIMQFMPIMFGAFMLTLPAGLTLYMLVNSIASIIQQVMLNKKFDIKPTATLAARS